MRVLLFITFFSISILAANKPPFVSTPFVKQYIKEDDSLEINLDGHFSDSDGVISRYRVINAPGISRITMTSTFCKIVPERNKNGSISIQVVAYDNSGDSIYSEIDLIIHAVNDPPEFLYQPGDTVLFTNEELKISKKKLAIDIDSYIQFEIPQIPGVSIDISEDTIKVIPYQRIDTLSIKIRIYDDSGAGNTTTFKLYANCPVNMNKQFRIQGDFTRTSIYYPNYRFSAYCKQSTDTTILVCGFLNGKLYIDEYNLFGQKVFPTLIFQSLQKSLLTDVFIKRLKNGKLFIEYPQNNVWQCLITDTSLNTATKYSPDSSMYQIVEEGVNSIYAFGRVVGNGTNRSLCVDIFDYDLHLIRTDTVTTDATISAPLALFVDNEGYVVFWNERINNSKFTNMIKARRFNNSGNSLIYQEQVVPYLQRNSLRPINYDITAKIINCSDNRFLVTWSFSDAAYDTEYQTYSVSFVPMCYGELLDKSLKIVSQPKILNKDTIGFRNISMDYLAFKNNRFFAAWRNYGGNGDTIYRRHGFFDENLNLLGKMESDSIVQTSYIIPNDSVLFKMENRNDGKLYGMFISPLFDNVTTILDKNINKRQFGCARNLRSILSSPDYYDLRGRKISSFETECQINNLHSINGIYINKSHNECAPVLQLH